MRVRVHTCVGGTSRVEDSKILRRGGIHVVVGTPGRVFDMLKWGAIRTEHLRICVMDEADQLLSEKSYEELIRPIFGYFYDDIQIALFSATFPKDVLERCEDFMGDPVKTLVKKEDLPLKGINQYFVPVERQEWKLEMFLQLYEELESIKKGTAIVYCNTNKGV